MMTYELSQAYGTIIWPVEVASLEEAQRAYIARREESGMGGSKFGPGHVTCRETGALYAEENCDLAVVFAAHHKATGSLPKLKETYTDRTSPIRHMPRCTGIRADWKAAHAYLDANAKQEAV